MLIINNDSTYEVTNEIIAFVRTISETHWYSFVDSERTKISIAVDDKKRIKEAYDFYKNNFDNIKDNLPFGLYNLPRGICYHGLVARGSSKKSNEDGNIATINNEKDFKHWIKSLCL